MDFPPSELSETFRLACFMTNSVIFKLCPSSSLSTTAWPPESSSPTRSTSSSSPNNPDDDDASQQQEEKNCKFSRSNKIYYNNIVFALMNENQLFVLDTNYLDWDGKILRHSRTRRRRRKTLRNDDDPYFRSPANIWIKNYKECLCWWLRLFKTTRFKYYEI